MYFTADDMNKKQFSVSIPEIYTKIIPDYFLNKRKPDLPRLNGVAVSVDEFKEKFSDYTPEEGFIPDMVFNPPELNVASAFSSVSDIVDMISNDITFCIYNPFISYPKIIEILDGYIENLRRVASADPELELYLDKAESASQVLHDYYLRFKNAYLLKATGECAPELQKKMKYDVIARKFKKGAGE